METVLHHTEKHIDCEACAANREEIRKTGKLSDPAADHTEFERLTARGYSPEWIVDALRDRPATAASTPRPAKPVTLGTIVAGVFFGNVLAAVVFGIAYELLSFK